jgi:hypothetical protein
VTRLVLLPSPLLGPRLWESVAEALRARGWRLSVAALPERVASPEDTLGGFLVAAPDEPGLVLVPHSNAGRYVAAIAEQRDVAATVFVDATPPEPETTPMAPPELIEHLQTLVDTDGLLPPWTRWWPPEEVAGLFPDDAARRLVEEGQPRLPLAYFQASLPGPSRWDGAAAYLAFGDGYAGERDAATDRGWPVRTLPGGHLHMLVDPDAVATAVESLLGELAVQAG